VKSAGRRAAGHADFTLAALSVAIGTLSPWAPGVSQGDHQRTNRRQFNKDIRRIEILTDLGWIVVRVTSADCDAAIVRRVAAARARRA
jgi:hypothetical protein